MSKSQSGLSTLKRDWSVTSSTAAPKSSQEIPWSPTPPKPAPQASSSSAGLTGREKRLRDIQNALDSRSTPAVAQPKRSSDTEASDPPPAKKKRQLPPGYGDNAAYVPPRYPERDDDDYDPAKRAAHFSSVSRPALNKSTYTAPPPKKVSAVFLSQEQTQILKLVQEGSSVFYTGSAGTGKSVLLREIIKTLKKKHSKAADAVAITASTGEPSSVPLSYFFLRRSRHCCMQHRWHHDSLILGDRTGRRVC
ncbi:hypothetical protein DFH06DRAFT_992481 [Mycena polygramma]|nr:hypothetical protein DFH06DRAFT_992481 [Mycena polygramma]